jgi:uncharacterized protein YwgA
MTKYQLAKLVAWAGTFHTRKRVQKSIHLLQAAGCPFRVEHRLHHYGPYSYEVADLTDELTREGVFQETNTPTAVGRQYNYALSEAARRTLEAFERTPGGARAERELQPFEPLFRRLLSCDLRELELASTIMYYKQHGLDWSQAAEATARFKCESAGGPVMERAAALAQSLVSG